MNTHGNDDDAAGAVTPPSAVGGDSFGEGAGRHDADGTRHDGRAARRLRIPLSLTMAWRETRGGWRRFIYFVACLAIGVGAVVGIELFAANVERLILGDARSLLGGDIEIRPPHDLDASGHATLASLAQRDIAVTSVWELVGMAASPPPPSSPAVAVPAAPPSNLRAARSTQLVELKAVESRYPLYGRVVVSPARPLPALLAAASSCPARPCFGAVVEDSLLTALGLRVGASLKIGHAWFTITGVVHKEPDRVTSAFSLGPRVIISRDALTATELLQVGSRVRRRYLLRVPATVPLAPLVEELHDRLADDRVTMTTFRSAQPRLRHLLDQFTMYLGLIALTALFVGGIGVACTIHGFIAQKLTTVAMIKALGADNGLIMRMYAAQSGIIGGVGSLIGAAVGVGVQLALPALFGGLLPAAATMTVTAMPLLKGFIIGIGTTLCFTLWPLLAIRDVPPARVFRRDVEQVAAPPPPTASQPPPVDVASSMASSSSSRSPAGVVSPPPSPPHEPPAAVVSPLSSPSRTRTWASVFPPRFSRGAGIRVLAGGVIGAGLLLLSMWQARSASMGAMFLLAFGGALVVLRAGVWCLFAVLRRLPRRGAFVLRHALGRIRQPGNDTTGMAVAIGVGVMVMVTVALVKVALLSAIVDRIPDDAPAFFFLDIQPDQRARFEDIVRVHDGAVEVTPVVRSRLASINGVPVDPDAHKDQRHGWYFTREYVLTALDVLPKGNTIIKGSWWPPPRHAAAARPTVTPGHGRARAVSPSAVGDEPMSPPPSRHAAVARPTVTPGHGRARAASPSAVGDEPPLPPPAGRSGDAARFRVSVEEEAADILGLDVGGTVTFDVQGVSMSAVVDSHRRVEWGSLSTNFFMILSPDALDDAPRTYLATARVGPADERPLQQAVVRALPNVTAIQIGDVLANVARLLGQIAGVVQGLAFLCILSGVAVMVAAVSSTRYRRLHEAAVLAVVGGARRMVGQSFALEFAVVGALAGLLGVGLAAALSWAMLRWFLDLPWVFQPAIIGGGFAATVGLAVAVGFLSTWRILGEPPLAVLRRE